MDGSRAAEKCLQNEFIPTRTIAQVKIHAKKHFDKLRARQQRIQERSGESSAVDDAAAPPAKKEFRTRGARRSKRNKDGHGSEKNGKINHSGEGGKGGGDAPGTLDEDTGTAEAIAGEVSRGG